MDINTANEVTPSEGEAIARGLYAVARADGVVHEREKALIASFYDDTAGAGPVSLLELERAPDITPESLALALGTPDGGELFLESALLLAYADNTVTPAERALIGTFASALGVEENRLAELEQGVRDVLVGQLLGLSNVESVAEIAKNLGK